MKRLPTMKQLEYLAALADTRHFGRASERCHVTQSTLSAGIRDLESVLGTAVAERSNRRVLITRVGMQIAERAKALLRDAEEVMELARAGRSPMTGEMRLGVIPTIGPFYLPRVLPALREKFPELTLYLREEQTAPLLARLEDGELDAALIALPYDIGDLAAEVILEDEFLFACDRTHALAGARRGVARSARRRTPAAARGRPLPARPRARCLPDGRSEGAGAVRGQQPAHAGADGGGGNRRHPGAPARGRRPDRAGNGSLALAACRARVATDRTGMAPDVVESGRVPVVCERAAPTDRRLVTGPGEGHAIRRRGTAIRAPSVRAASRRDRLQLGSSSKAHPRRVPATVAPVTESTAHRPDNAERSDE